MFTTLSRMLYRFLPFILGVLLFWQSLSINYNEHQFKHVIKVDGLGYYSYLPSVFIYKDKNFAFLDTVFGKHKPYSDGFQSIYSIQPDGKKLENRYSPGLAITQMPFWFIAHSYGKIIGEDKGYEVHYQLSVLVAMLFYVFLGLLFLHWWMQKLEINKILASSILIGLVFGTNLFQYATFDGSLTHATSFGLVGMLIWLFEKLKENNTGFKFYLFTGLICGLLVLIRPVNLLMMPFFILIFNFEELKKLIVNRFRSFLLILLGLFLMILVLPIAWYLLSGNWFLYSYGKEVFDFSNPHLFSFLFSYESGFFLYSPWMFFVVFFGISGLLAKMRWFELGSFVMLFFGIVYVFSSWWDWTYGCSLGCRPFVEFLPLFCVPFVKTVIHKRKKIVEAFTLFVLILCVFYNQVLCYQYRNRIIDWCNVNKKDYWDVFMRMDKKYAFYTWPEWDFTQYNGQKTLDSLFVNFEKLPLMPKKEDQRYIALSSDPSQSANYCLEIREGKTIVLYDTIPPFPSDGKRYYYAVKLKAMFAKERTEDIFGIYYQKDGVYVDLLKSMFKKHIPKIGEWVTYEFNGHTPTKEKGVVKMEVYVQSTIDKNLYIDDLEIKLKEYEEKK